MPLPVELVSTYHEAAFPQRPQGHICLLSDCADLGLTHRLRSPGHLRAIATETPELAEPQGKGEK